MTGQTFRAAVVFTCVAAVGCVQINHKGYDTALRCSPEQTILPPLRSQVYVFVLNGADPLEDGAMLRLRDEVTRAGYPMVYYAQRADAEWYYREMHRVVHDQPAARLILVGFGVAASKSRELACTAVGEGLPLDALVLLDPADGRGDEQVADERVPTTTLRSHSWPGGRNIAGEVTELPGVGHLSLPSHPQTVATLLRLLAVSATRVQLGPPDALPHLPLTDHPQPTPRPLLPTVIADVGPPANTK